MTNFTFWNISFVNPPQPTPGVGMNGVAVAAICAAVSWIALLSFLLIIYLKGGPRSMECAAAALRQVIHPVFARFLRRYLPGRDPADSADGGETAASDPGQDGQDDDPDDQCPGKVDPKVVDRAR